MSETKFSKNKKNRNRVKAKDRGLASSTQHSYYRKKVKEIPPNQSLFV